jgi:hypothetical protein
MRYTSILNTDISKKRKIGLIVRNTQEEVKLEIKIFYETVVIFFTTQTNLNIEGKHMTETETGLTFVISCK